MNRRNGGGGHWQHCECGLFCYGELLVFGGTYCRTLFAAITKSFLTGPLESFFVLAYRHPNTPVPLTMSAHAPCQPPRAHHPSLSLSLTNTQPSPITPSHAPSIIIRPSFPAAQKNKQRRRIAINTRRPHFTVPAPLQVARRRWFCLCIRTCAAPALDSSLSLLPLAANNSRGIVETRPIATLFTMGLP